MFSSHLAHDLAAFVRRGVQEGSSLDDIERGTLSRVLALGAAAVGLFLEAQGDGDLGPCVEVAGGRTLYRSASAQERPVRTIFGEHAFAAYVYAAGSKRPIELRPIDARLNLPPGKASYLLQEFSQLFCVEKAFAVGAGSSRPCSANSSRWMSSKTSTGPWARRPTRFLEEVPAPPPAEEGAILVATADGKGVPLVRADAAQVPVFEQQERPGNRRMATLGCVYTVDPYVRTPEQIVAALFRDDAVSQPADRPEACHKHYRAYFAAAGADRRGCAAGCLSDLGVARRGGDRPLPAGPSRSSA